MTVSASTPSVAARKAQVEKLVGKAKEALVDATGRIELQYDMTVRKASGGEQHFKIWVEDKRVRAEGDLGRLGPISAKALEASIDPRHADQFDALGSLLGRSKWMTFSSSLVQNMLGNSPQELHIVEVFNRVEEAVDKVGDHHQDALAIKGNKVIYERPDDIKSRTAKAEVTLDSKTHAPKKVIAWDDKGNAFELSNIHIGPPKTPANWKS